MLLHMIKTVSPDKAKERLTDTEYKLFLYLKSGNRTKDVNKVCGQLNMSRSRLTKTMSSLEFKLSRM